MKEKIVYGSTLPNAYHRALIQLHDSGEIADCADWNTKQKELSMTIVVAEPLKEPMISKCFIGGQKELEQYRQEMLDGILDFEVERGNWDYTYHDRMVNYPMNDAFKPTIRNKRLDKYGADQIHFVINELKRNPSSRRAVMIIRDVAIDMVSADPACLNHIQYFIRNGKLECKVLFRSNDACKATFMNAFALICLQERIANELGVPVGQYVHRANSFHCYEQDFGLLDGYVLRIEDAEDKYDVCYDYKGDWEEDMAEYRDEIMEQVEVLKARGGKNV